MFQATPWNHFARLHDSNPWILSSIFALLWGQNSRILFKNCALPTQLPTNAPQLFPKESHLLICKQKFELRLFHARDWHKSIFHVTLGKIISYRWVISLSQHPHGLQRLQEMYWSSQFHWKKRCREDWQSQRLKHELVGGKICGKACIFDGKSRGFSLRFSRSSRERPKRGSVFALPSSSARPKSQVQRMRQNALCWQGFKSSPLSQNETWGSSLRKCHWWKHVLAWGRCGQCFLKSLAAPVLSADQQHSFNL